MSIGSFAEQLWVGPKKCGILKEDCSENSSRPWIFEQKYTKSIASLGILEDECTENTAKPSDFEGECTENIAETMNFEGFKKH